MTWGAVAGAAISVGGGLLAKDAGDGQSEAAGQAAALQQEQYKQTREDLTPFRNTGVQANSKLAYLLGLGGSGGGAGSAPTREQLRQQLLGQFTTTTPSSISGLPVGVNAVAGAKDGQQGYYVDNYQGGSDWIPMSTSTTGGTSIDEAGLNAAIEAQLSQQFAPSGDDEFGSLLKKYTGQELLTDPGYLFRRSEGQKGVERSAAGRGGLFSGQAGKELERFNQGLASTEFQAGFNRDQAYKGQTYGMLSGTAGAGQNAANMTGTAGAQAAAGAGNYLTQGANAAAAGQVGLGNALTSGYNNYQNYNMLNSLFNKTTQGGGSSAYDPVANYGRGFGGSGD